jgi:hypothetical protein
VHCFVLLQEDEAISKAIAASLAAVSPPADTSAPSVRGDEQYDDDIELALALSMSNEAKPGTSPAPADSTALPPEPAPGTPGVANVKVRLPPRKV